MEDEISAELFTYEGRLASFQKSRKRASAANGRGKVFSWPHKSISPEDLAKAGFYYEPSSENPDNVVCFICRKNMDGWEAGDDPLLEHLDHAGGCGWALVGAVEAEVRGYATQNPNAPEMVEARKATFAKRWPHEGKRGWKCKTKQLVEAGWKYTPSLDSDDMSTCAYCQLSLDGWEQNDKPWDEHQSRAPNCPFFKLYEQFGPAKKRTARSKTAKAARLSTQSTAPSETTTFDLTSMTTTTIGMDDTALTTTSTATQGTKKGRARKGTTSKPKKTRAKREEATELENPPPEIAEAPPSPAEVIPDFKAQPEPEPEPELEPLIEPEPIDEPAPAPKTKTKAKAKRGKKKASEVVEDSKIEESVVPKPLKEPAPEPTTQHEHETTPRVEMEVESTPSLNTIAKANRGTKRGSEAVEESTITAPDAPATKRRDTQTREGSVDTFITANEDTQMTVEPPMRKPSGARKVSGTRKASAARTALANRKASALSRASSLSAASTVVPMEEFPDDDEIERQLQADLDQISDDEAPAKYDLGQKGFESRKSLEIVFSKPAEPSHYAMFDPAPQTVDEAIIENELQALQSQMDVDAPQEEQLILPKKTRKAAARKTSKQVKGKKAKAPSPPVEEEPELVPNPQGEEVLEEEGDASLGSTDTVIKKDVLELDPESEQPKSERGRLSKVSFYSQEPEETMVASEPKQPVKRARGRPPKALAGSPEQKQTDSAIPDETEQPKQPTKRSRGRPPKASIASQASTDHDTSKAADTSRSADAAKTTETVPKRGRGRPPKLSSSNSKAQEWKAPKMPGAFREDTVEPLEQARSTNGQDGGEVDDGASDELAQDFPMPPTKKALIRTMKASASATPGQLSSPATARQAVLSPSLSPQASDAENQPPSSLPASSAVKRTPLAPMTAVPLQTSPSKRNVVAGLQSSIRWTAVDLEKIIGSAESLTDKENGMDLLSRKELTSPEKEMTVEEWIHFNAEQAEKALRHECEAMVIRFENEGTRAMRVLEGLEVME